MTAMPMDKMKFNEEYLDVAGVTLRWDVQTNRYIGFPSASTAAQPNGTTRKARKRRAPAARPPSPPGGVITVTLAANSDLASVPLPQEFDALLKGDPAHQAARLRYREIWNDVYGLQQSDRHRKRVLDLIDVNNEIAAAAATAAFRLGLQAAAIANGGDERQVVVAPTKRVDR